MAKSVDEAELKRLHKVSIHHRERIERSDKCGCFQCLGIYAPTEITEWVDDGQTAICPYCGIDSVIDDTQQRPLTKELLKAMQMRRFGAD